jgi:hypothetical protein
VISGSGMEFATASPPIPVVKEANIGPNREAQQISDSGVRTTECNTFKFLCQLAKCDYCGLQSSDEFLRPEQVVWGTPLGKGAYALVHTARTEGYCKHTDMSQVPLIAVKQLKPAVAEDKVELKFFLLEAHILSLLKHPCVATFLHV